MINFITVFTFYWGLLKKKINLTTEQYKSRWYFCTSSHVFIMFEKILKESWLNLVVLMTTANRAELTGGSFYLGLWRVGNWRLLGEGARGVRCGEKSNVGRPVTAGNNVPPFWYRILLSFDDLLRLRFTPLSSISSLAIVCFWLYVKLLCK